ENISRCNAVVVGGGDVAKLFVGGGFAEFGNQHHVHFVGVFIPAHVEVFFVGVSHWSRPFGFGCGRGRSAFLATKWRGLQADECTRRDGTKWRTGSGLFLVARGSRRQATGKKLT